MAGLHRLQRDKRQHFNAGELAERTHCHDHVQLLKGVDVQNSAAALLAGDPPHLLDLSASLVLLHPGGQRLEQRQRHLGR
jgi:hypothetical protein